MIMKTNEIPAYTRIGIKVTAVLMLVLVVMLLKNCIGSIHYGVSTDDDEIQHYYQMGYDDGFQQAQGNEPGKVFQNDNPLLKKTYNRGFRTGWDSARREGGQGAPVSAEKKEDAL